MIKTCDILIIGGGPAGLSAALLLSKKGFNNIIVEKNKKIGLSNPKYDITESVRITKILDILGIKPHKTSNISEWISNNYKYILKSKIDDYYFKRGNDNNSFENKLFNKIETNSFNDYYDSKILSISTKKNKIKG